MLQGVRRVSQESWLHPQQGGQLNHQQQNRQDSRRKMQKGAHASLQPLASNFLSNLDH